jgi:hypothetical protein
MSGLYADVPGNRMAYHKDGSQCIHINEGNALTLLANSNLQTFNDENDGTNYQIWSAVSGSSGTHTRYLGMVFPELRDIVGYFVAGSNPNLWGGAAWSYQASANTTNGVDGTWTGANITIAGGSSPTYRSGIQALSRPGIKGIRFGRGWSANGPVHLYTIHLYGKPTAGQPRWLIFTDTGGTEVTGPYFDFADDARGGAPEVKTFKIQNGHATLTANSIVLSVSTLTNKSPSFTDDYEFSSDGVSYSATLNIGALAAGASSATLYVRRTTPIGAALGLEAPLLEATAGSWT